MSKSNEIAICFLNSLCFNLQNLQKLKFSSALPNVFTEHGVAMLGSILNSEQAIAFSFKIVETFVKMREFLTTDLNLK
ncbi:MAG: hypothetical protein RLZZ312_384 [Bacteroidota bacterium]|jgi:hypothetical protein